MAYIITMIYGTVVVVIVFVATFTAWHNHGRPNCGRVVETSYQVRMAPLSSIAYGPKLKEHDVLRLGVHNDKGTPDIECLLSQWRMLDYNKTHLEFNTCMQYGVRFAPDIATKAPPSRALGPTSTPLHRSLSSAPWPRAPRTLPKSAQRSSK